MLGLALYDSEEGKRRKRKVEREEREREEEEEEESLWKKINRISVLLGSSELFLKVLSVIRKNCFGFMAEISELWKFLKFNQIGIHLRASYSFECNTLNE